MFGLVTIDNRTFVIVKKEIIPNGEVMPTKWPFEVYGFLYKQRSGNTVMCSIVSESGFSEAEQASLIEQAMDESRSFFKDRIF